MGYQNLIVTHDPPVVILQINRPKSLNALNTTLMKEMAHAAHTMDADPAIRCIIITGNERAFAAGADIQEMVDASPVELLYRNTLGFWDELQNVSKPLIAAVSGYALGGGCELALLCDLIVVWESAIFGQPEINIGVILGAGNAASRPSNWQAPDNGNGPDR